MERKSSWLLIISFFSAMSVCPWRMAHAQDAVRKERADFWVGSGVGAAFSERTAVPLRFNLGAEVLMGAERRWGVSYRLSPVISNDDAGFRMLHSLPGVRFYILPAVLSVYAAPGFAMQGMGMMGRDRSDRTMRVSAAGSFAAEYRIRIENAFALGLEVEYDYIAPASAGAFTRAHLLTGALNVHFLVNDGSQEMK